MPKRFVRMVANRYIAGETIAEAVAVVKELNTLGAKATVDVLGEFVSSRDRAVNETQMAADVLDAIAQHDLRSGLSVKLTSLGLDIDQQFCYNNLRRLVQKARDAQRFLRIDMENSPYTSQTLDMYRRLRDEGFDNIGVVLQAYMRRSADDIRALKSLQASVRLCKGIYNESAEIAYKGREEVRDNYKRLLRQLVEQDMYVGIATHDDVLIDDARSYLSQEAISKDRYEFQMLLGVRLDKRDELLQQQHPMRIYVPFGIDWYGYSVRRLNENPQIAGHVMKAFFSRGR